jgi:hypothetical protein
LPPQKRLRLGHPRHSFASKSALDNATVNCAATNRKVKVPNAAGVWSRSITNDKAKCVPASATGPMPANAYRLIFSR